MGKFNSNGNKISYTYTLDLNSGVVRFTDHSMNFTINDTLGYLDSGAIAKYNAIDDEFDMLDDKTSHARELLKAIGINCGD